MPTPFVQLHFPYELDDHFRHRIMLRIQSACFPSGLHGCCCQDGIVYISSFTRVPIAINLAGLIDYPLINRRSLKLR